MQIRQSQWSAPGGFIAAPPKADLAFVFASPRALREGPWRTMASSRHVVGCTTAGEIAGTLVRDESAVVTAVTFDGATRVDSAISPLQGGDGREAGAELARRLTAPGLRHVVVFAAGARVNGSELVAGLVRELPPEVAVTGGIAADGARFGSTYVVYGDDVCAEAAVAVGFSGPGVHVGYGSLGGWDSFGPDRRVTRSAGNVLYELDGRPALDFYKHYLGDHAADLPASALRFPLSVRDARGVELVRTVLGIDEGDQSMTFAGDVPMGAMARLMKANIDRLVDGATGAARRALQRDGESPELALLISCVGRKLVLRQRVEEEAEAVRDVFGPSTRVAGFYSYGEICPFTRSGPCELHNQTMTITTISEGM